MALRFHLLQFVRRQANNVAALADRWATSLQPNDSEFAPVGEVYLPVPYPVPSIEADGQIIPLTNQDGELQAGLLSYGLDKSRSIIDHLRQEELYGTGLSEGGAISAQVGDAVAGLTPAILTGLKLGQLYQVIGPASVVQGLAQGTMQMVPSHIGGALGVVTRQGASQFVGQARFAQMTATSVVAPLMVYQAVHMIVGTQQINAINRRLANIERTLERIVQRQNAKDLGEVIAAASTLRDILQEHQHSGHFNAQMRDRLSHCERDLRAHLERLKLLKSQFHTKLAAAQAKSTSRDRGVQLATLIKEEGEQFGQDTHLLIALCGAVMQLEQGLMAIALEHHPESLPYRQKQMRLQMVECQETLRGMVNLSEVQGEIRSCLEEMNWWQENLFDRSGAAVLKEASSSPMNFPEHTSSLTSEGGIGSMLVWMDPQKGLRVRALSGDEPSNLTLPKPIEAAHVETSKKHEDALSDPEEQHQLVAIAPSHSLREDEVYWLPVMGSRTEIQVRILKKISPGRWKGQRVDNLKTIGIVVGNQ
jgi:hypothetical protein